MKPGWNAAATRGRLLLSRRLGPDRARAIAGSDWAEVLRVLEGSGYGHYLPRAATRWQAESAVRRTCIWNLRVLAGWSPPRGADVLRSLAGRFEIDATQDHLATISSPVSSRVEPDQHLTSQWYRPGALSTSWRRIAASPDPGSLREALSASVWGDPGGTDSAAIAIAMQARWATWAADSVPESHSWAQASAALVAARWVAAGNRVAALPLQPRTHLVSLLGRRITEVDGLPALTAALPADCRALFDGIRSRDDLWLAEGRWWRRWEADAQHVVASSRNGAAVTAAAATALMVDAWRVVAAMEAAEWGPPGAEVFDAVA